MIIDLHTHSYPLSGCSSAGPGDLIEQAKLKGLDGICFTEHDVMWPEDNIRELSEATGFPIFRGMEVSTDHGHILVFGLPKYIPGIHRAETLRQIVNSFSGYMILAHPFRGFVNFGLGYTANRQTMVFQRKAKLGSFRRVDAIEMYNGARPDDENQFAAETCEEMGLKGIGGSDAHSRTAVGQCATLFERRFTTEAELIAELRAGRYSALRSVSEKNPE